MYLGLLPELNEVTELDDLNVGDSFWQWWYVTFVRFFQNDDLGDAWQVLQDVAKFWKQLLKWKRIS